MEPYPKRQRLYAPLSREFTQGFDNQHAYYDKPAAELEDDFEEELEDEMEEEEQEETVSDPDVDLQQKRARLDYKLKSTFEAIFEKYGQEFDGVGDEIDLETGDIVVDNGHLLEMQDERDAGDTSRVLRDYTEEPEDVPSSSLEETEILDDEDEEETMSDDEEMIEDDMILRGFVRANRFIQASPELGNSRATLPPQRNHRQATVSRPSMRVNALPSRTDILAQFGPQLGPQIVNIVSQQQVPDDSHIEPAWRAPQLPTVAPVKRPKIKRVVLEPEIERSPSPEAVESVWAPIRARGRRPLDGADSDAIFRGESMRPIQQRKSQALDPFKHQSKTDLSFPSQMSPPKGKGTRQRFTAEDDEILLDWVAKTRAQGLPLWSNRIWQELAAKVISPSWIQSTANDNSIRVIVSSHGRGVTGTISHIFGQMNLKIPSYHLPRPPSVLTFWRSVRPQKPGLELCHTFQYVPLQRNDHPEFANPLNRTRESSAGQKQSTPFKH